MEISDPRVEKNLAELIHFLTETEDSRLIGDFLHCLLTPAEIADIAARWALVKALKNNVSQRNISRDLGISLCKITRGSRELKKPESAFRKVFEKYG
ncbi:MAG: trp operon repressor [Treponema sp.]|nr:trp operon repressor [Treponema sp.]